MAKLTTKFKSLKKTTKVDFATYLGVIAVFIVVTVLQNGGMLNRKTLGLLVPICCYMSMAVSLNLTVGILGELSLGHAGFMSVGAFSGVIVSQSLLTAVPNAPVRLAIAMVVGAIFAAIVGLLVGTPVLRLQGDYLAIVTLAFGEIIADLINCLLVGYDASGLHILFNVSGTKTIDDLGLDATGYAIIKGAQGATGTKTIAGLTAGFILVMVTLIIVLNFTTSILVLVFVALGGLGNIWGSLLSAAALTILPEALRQFADYRMLVYAIVLIFVMLATNNPRFKAFFAKLLPRRHSAEEKEV